MARRALRDVSRPWATAALAGGLVVASRALMAGSQWRIVSPALCSQRQRLGRLATIGTIVLMLRPVPAEQWCRVISAWARRMPGAHCLVRALAAEAALRVWRRPVSLRIGVAQLDGAFTAHAWLEHDGKLLIGGQDAAAYQALRCGTGLLA